MTVTKELIQQEIEKLNEKQLQQVFDYITLIQFQAQKNTLPDEQKLAALYQEFAQEDRELAEQGMAEYAKMLREED